MALIRFTDRSGTEWEVWEVGVRSTDGSPLEVTKGTERWLCFESATERRRLARYPQRWFAMTPRDLDALLRAATVATVTLRPPPQANPPSDVRRDESLDAGS